MTLKMVLKALQEAQDWHYDFSDSILPPFLRFRRIEFLKEQELLARPVVDAVIEEWLRGMEFPTLHVNAPENVEFFLGLRFRYSRRALSLAGPAIVQGKSVPACALSSLVLEQWTCSGLNQWLEDCAIELAAYAQGVRHATTPGPN